MSLRAQFGLDASLAHVRGVRGAAHTRELGIPLSAAEAANILARDALVEVATKLDRVGAKTPGYAGSWVDQAAGGVLHIGVQRGTSAGTVRDLQAMVPTRDRVETSPTARSLATLSTTQGQVTAQIVSDASFRHWVVQSVLMPQINAVRLTLLKGAPVSLTNGLRARYLNAGLAIDYASAQFQPQSRDLGSGLLYGGEWTGGCTVGYSKTTGTDGLAYTVTAGHCGNGNRYQGHENQGTYLGFGHNNHYTFGGYSSSNCDCVAIGALHSGLATNQVLVANNGLYTYTNTATSGNYTSGQRECMSGAAYADAHGGNLICGQMVGSGSVPYQDGAYTLTDAGVTSNAGTLAGDSGAPYGNGGSFLGIHAANNPGLGESAFSKSTHLGVTGVTLHY